MTAAVSLRRHMARSFAVPVGAVLGTLVGYVSTAAYLGLL